MSPAGPGLPPFPPRVARCRLTWNRVALRCAVPCRAVPCRRARAALRCLCRLALRRLCRSRVALCRPAPFHVPLPAPRLRRRAVLPAAARPAEPHVAPSPALASRRLTWNCAALLLAVCVLPAPSWPCCCPNPPLQPAAFCPSAEPAGARGPLPFPADPSSVREALPALPRARPYGLLRGRSRALGHGGVQVGPQGDARWGARTGVGKSPGAERRCKERKAGHGRVGRAWHGALCPFLPPARPQERDGGVPRPRAASPGGAAFPGSPGPVGTVARPGARGQGTFGAGGRRSAPCV